MNFLEKIKETARSQKKTIVLPEALEIRTLEATAAILKEEIANVILVGNKDEIMKLANGFDIEKATFIDPAASEHTEDFVQTFYEMRKAKGMTEEKAASTMLDPVFFGCMLVKKGLADGMVAGAIHSTADILRPALQIIKTAPGTKIVSTFFVMQVPNCEFGDNGTFVFADCALNIDPTAEEMAHIAISSANSYKALVGGDPAVAMLSFSTMGSASHEKVDKVVEATKIARELAPDLKLDGELQLDAAIVEKVGKQKSPNSEVAGKANVLIFPDINSGNIGYKLVQRLAKAEAYGPATQGLAKPVNDLSRGCSAADIVGTVAITAVQAQMQG
ncbi:phosphate acetyltransferase Pta [Peptoclostridium acidaminophilum DSM 3953]|uniref:Phosphate acetyltransferase n=1 Tax=Peptoclostridium acidaminophilum DSM 3953 TaxID=1286171 RepID=W8T3G0_PEPAC|nr:phosphate acetyltransferase [Peptoclostridium acidaminophilum]AHM56304.1 phosphate acetyltransferase Pta [Peptoclostridium acidaminophilum DSM 3953]